MKKYFFLLLPGTPSLVDVLNLDRKDGESPQVEQQQRRPLREAIARKKRNFMKKFHKMVTPPPRTAFMKSLFRTLTVFLRTFTVLNKRYEIRLTPLCEIFS